MEKVENTPNASLQSLAVRAAPRLSKERLSLLLILMAITPVLTIIWLQAVLPPVKPGKLPAEASLYNVPPPSYFEQKVSERPTLPPASVIVKNVGDEEWTHINIRINRNYQIYEYGAPLLPGSERNYRLDRFVSRTGATLDVSRVRINDIEIYARLPNRSRATFEQDF